MTHIKARSFSEYISLLWRRRVLIATIAAPLWISAVLVCRKIPDVYESKALAVLAIQNGDAPAAMARLSAVSYDLTSRTALQALIERHSLYPTINDKDDAVQAMSRDLKVATQIRTYAPQVPESFRLTFRYGDPMVAEQVMADVMGIFKAANTDARAAFDAESVAVADMIGGVEDKMSEREVVPSSGFNHATLAAVRDRSVMESLEDRRYTLEQEIVEQNRLIAAERLAVGKLPAAPAAKADTAMGVLLSNRANLVAAIKDYASQYTEKNPKLVQARLQLAELNRQIERLESLQEPAPVPRELQELTTLEHGLAQFKIDLALVERQLERQDKLSGAVPPGAAGSGTTPGSIVAETPVNSQGEVLRSRYVALLDHRDRLNAVRGAGGPLLFRIVDPPSSSQSPVGPNRMMFTVLITVMSIIISVAVVGVLEFRRMGRIRDAVDVDYYLGVPVLAMIPRSLIPKEFARERHLVLARNLATPVVAVCLVPLLMQLWTKLRIFQMLAGKL